MSKEQIPEDMAEIAIFAVKEGMKDYHTTTVGRVQEFDPETGWGRIEVVIQRLVLNLEVDEAEADGYLPEDVPLLIAVPVGMMKAGGLNMTFPVLEGAECIVHFFERDISTWKRQAEKFPPPSRRIMQYADSYFIPIPTSQPGRIENYDPVNFSIHNDANTGHVKLTPEGNIIMVAAESITQTASDVIVNGNFTVNGTGEFSGQLDAAEVTATDLDATLGTHNHDAFGTPPLTDSLSAPVTGFTNSPTGGS